MCNMELGSVRLGTPSCSEVCKLPNVRVEDQVREFGTKQLLLDGLAYDEIRAAPPKREAGS